MKIIVSFSVLIFYTNILFAQFYTPNTGIKWNLDSLVNNTSGVVSEIGGVYFLNNNLVVSQNDTLNIQTNDTLKLASSVSIDVYGAMFANPTNEFVITAVDILQYSSGLLFHDSQNSFLKRVTLQYSEGINITNSFVEIDSCILRNNDEAIAITNSSTNQMNYKINSNTIYNNGVGIKVVGNDLSGIISNNNITENDVSQGYGIYVNGDNTCIANIFKNQITNNINGIYTEGNCIVLMGGNFYDVGISIGQNTFGGNLEYDINNHSNSYQYAFYNKWGTFDSNEIANRIYDRADNNTLGSVYYYDLFHPSPEVNYYSFPNDYTVWSVNIEKFIQDGDTTVNSKQYKKIYFNNDCIISPENTSYKAAIRENIENKKLYIIPQDSTKEFLLYDFTLNVGDTAKILTVGTQWEGEGGFPVINIIQVNNIDSILLEDGNYHKRFRINSLTSYSWEEYWIEGLGSTLGPIYPGNSIFMPCKSTDGYPTLLCAEEDGLMFYDHPWYSCCEEVGGNVESVNKLFKLYPTIAQSKIIIEFLGDNFDNKNVEIVDIYGKVLRMISCKTKKLTIDVSLLSDGFYFIRTINNGKQQTHKFIVKH